MNGDIHTLPIADLVDHDEDRTCWCSPRLLLPCPEDCNTGCWRCDGGLVEVDASELEPVMVIHNAADGRD